MRLLVLQVSVWDAGWSLKTNEGRKRFMHLSGTLLHLLVLQSQLLMLYVDQVLVEGTGVSGCLQRIF